MTPSQPIRQETQQGLRVLVVDDSKTARFAMKRHLEKLRYEVVTVGSAHEAYSFLINHRPDVIFLDNIMPGISGMEALGTLQQNRKTSTIPVIFCTSIDTDEFITQALKSGAREVLHKPPTVDILSEVLRHIQSRNFRPPPRVVNPDPAPRPASTPPGLQPAAMQPTTDLANPSPLLIQKQIDAAFMRLKNELSVQISELQGELLAFETSNISPQEVQAFRRVAREEAEALNRELRMEMEAIQRRLDHITLRQIETMQQVLRSKGVDTRS